MVKFLFLSDVWNASKSRTVAKFKVGSPVDS